MIGASVPVGIVGGPYASAVAVAEFVVVAVVVGNVGTGVVERHVVVQLPVLRREDCRLTGSGDMRSHFEMVGRVGGVVWA